MIKYVPKMDSSLWSRKCQETFDTVEDMESFVADQREKFCRFVGRPVRFTQTDVILKHLCDSNPVLCLMNCRTVILDGTVVGYCGE